MKSSTMIGGSGAYGRSMNDFYTTPHEVTEALIAQHPEFKDGSILEPACGEGDMMQSMISLGCRSVSGSDIRNTAYTEAGHAKGGIDFLMSPPQQEFDYIITNPPFALASDFIRTSVSIARKGVAMLTKATYWNAAGRYGLFRDTRPAYVYPLTWRPTMAPDRGNSPTMDFIWTVWLMDYDGECRFFPIQKPKS